MIPHRQQLVCMVRRDSSLPAAGPAVLAMDTVLATDVLVSVLCIDVVDEPDGVEGVESYTLLLRGMKCRDQAQVR
jgi:hypothetical protein